MTRREWPWNTPATLPDDDYDTAVWKALRHVFGPDALGGIPLDDWVTWAQENRRRVWLENQPPHDPSLNADLTAYWKEPFNPQPPPRKLTRLTRITPITTHETR